LIFERFAQHQRGSDPNAAAKQGVSANHKSDWHARRKVVPRFQRGAGFQRRLHNPLTFFVGPLPPLWTASDLPML
jgi:hypothetical protein